MSPTSLLPHSLIFCSENEMIRPVIYYKHSCKHEIEHKKSACMIQTSFKVNICSNQRSSSHTVFLASFLVISLCRLQFSRNLGGYFKALLCPNDRWSHTASIIMRCRCWRGSTMADTVPSFTIPPYNACMCEGGSGCVNK